MKMKKNTSLIEKYIESSHDQRTSLFLGYPALRQDFLKIDMADLHHRANRDVDPVRRAGIAPIGAKVPARPETTPPQDVTPTPRGRVHPLVIVGAGLNGLAAAYELKKAGIRPVILDASDQPAVPWRNRHDQLRLNTHRLISHLPGMRIPRRCGAFPGRDDIVAYLEAYERFLNVPIHRHVRIRRIDPVPGGWRMTASDGIWRARDVIIATGHERVPVIPEWPGRQGFTGELLHVAHLGRIERFRDRRLLVIGAGNSGVSHLVRIKTKNLWVSVRNGPTILPARLLGIPLQLLSPLMAPLPARVTDALMSATERLSFGNLKKYHLPKHPDGVATRLMREGVAPAFDNGFVAALKAGRVAVLPQVERFDGGAVRLTGGETVRPDVVICATGYSPALENMVGHLGVLNDRGRPIFNGPESHPQFEGLWFMGMAPRLWGVFYAARNEARRLAASISKRQNAGGRGKSPAAPGCRWGAENSCLGRLPA